MNLNQNICFTPVLTSDAGASLTLKNWQEAGIDAVTYYLDALLMKPGFDFLSNLTDLRSYCGWPGTIILNATLPQGNAEGIYSLRSRYDGSRIDLDGAKFWLIIKQLQPDIVILPLSLTSYIKSTEQIIPENIRVYSSVDERSTRDSLSYSLFYEDSNKPAYLVADLSLEEMSTFKNKNLAWLESDKPASDAMNGQVYSKEGTISLLANDRAEQHEGIEAGCNCPTCVQGFTQAYLHHLLMQTPLLAYRFLIQHNAHYYRHLVQASL